MKEIDALDANGPEVMAVAERMMAQVQRDNVNHVVVASLRIAVRIIAAADGIGLAEAVDKVSGYLSQMKKNALRMGSPS